MQHLDLSEEEAAALVALLTRTIDGDRYPLSPRIRTLRAVIGVRSGPGMTTVAVDGGLQIDLADALQDADEEGVDGNQRTGVRRLDMTLVIAGVMLPRFAV